MPNSSHLFSPPSSPRQDDLTNISPPLPGGSLAPSLAFEHAILSDQVTPVQLYELLVDLLPPTVEFDAQEYDELVSQEASQQGQKQSAAPPPFLSAAVCRTVYRKLVQRHQLQRRRTLSKHGSSHKLAQTLDDTEYEPSKSLVFTSALLYWLLLPLVQLLIAYNNYQRQRQKQAKQRRRTLSTTSLQSPNAFKVNYEQQPLLSHNRNTSYNSSSSPERSPNPKRSSDDTKEALRIQISSPEAKKHALQKQQSHEEDSLAPPSRERLLTYANNHDLSPTRSRPSPSLSPRSALHLDHRHVSYQSATSPSPLQAPSQSPHLHHSDTERSRRSTADADEEHRISVLAHAMSAPQTNGQDDNDTSHYTAGYDVDSIARLVRDDDDDVVELLPLFNLPIKQYPRLYYCYSTYQKQKHSVVHIVIYALWWTALAILIKQHTYLVQHISLLEITPFTITTLLYCTLDALRLSFHQEETVLKSKFIRKFSYRLYHTKCYNAIFPVQQPSTDELHKPRPVAINIPSDENRASDSIVSTPHRSQSYNSALQDAPTASLPSTPSVESNKLQQYQTSNSDDNTPQTVANHHNHPSTTQSASNRPHDSNALVVFEYVYRHRSSPTTLAQHRTLHLLAYVFAGFMAAIPFIVAYLTAPRHQMHHVLLLPSVTLFRLCSVAVTISCISALLHILFAGLLHWSVYIRMMSDLADIISPQHAGNEYVCLDLRHPQNVTCWIEVRSVITKYLHSGSSTIQSGTNFQRHIWVLTCFFGVYYVSLCIDLFRQQFVWHEFEIQAIYYCICSLLLYTVNMYLLSTLNNWMEMHVNILRRHQFEITRTLIRYNEAERSDAHQQQRDGVYPASPQPPQPLLPTDSPMPHHTSHDRTRRTTSSPTLLQIPAPNNASPSPHSSPADQQQTSESHEKPRTNYHTYRSLLQDSSVLLTSCIHLITQADMPMEFLGYRISYTQIYSMLTVLSTLTLLAVANFVDINI